MRDCDRHNRGLTSVLCNLSWIANSACLQHACCLLPFKRQLWRFLLLKLWFMVLQEIYQNPITFIVKMKKQKNEILCFIERTRSVLVFIYLFLQLKGEF